MFLQAVYSDAKVADEGPTVSRLFSSKKKQNQQTFLWKTLVYSGAGLNNWQAITKNFTTIFRGLVLTKRAMHGTSAVNYQLKLHDMAQLNTKIWNSGW